MDDIGSPKRVLSWKTIFLILLTLVVLLVFFIFLSRNVDYYIQLFQFSISAFGGLIGLSLIAILLNGLINYTLFRGLGSKLTINEGIGLAAINSLGNQLPFPAGGLILTGIYLKKQFSLGYSKFLSAALAFYILSVTTNGLIGTAVLTYWGLVDGIKIPTILLVGFMGMAASFLVLLLPIQNLFITGKWGQRIVQAFEGWQVVRKNKWLVIKILSIQLVFLAVYAIELQISFLALSQKITFAQCILFSAANVLTQLFSITPDALGVRETMIAGIASLLGFDLGTSIIAVGLIRIVVFPLILVIGSLYTYIFSRKTVENNNPPT